MYFSINKDDGTDMNKIIKSFNDHLIKKQLKNADTKINYL